MKNFKRRLAARVTAAVLMITLLAGFQAPVARAAVEANPMMKIGLFYGDNALATANLQNLVGSGYQFGYFTTGRQFIQTGATAQTAITVVKDRNVYMKDGVYYESSVTGGLTIGCYHIDLGITFGSSAAAVSQASALQSSGLAAYPVYANGQHRVRVGMYASSTIASNALPTVKALGFSSAEAMTGSTNCVSVVVTATGAPLYQYDGTLDECFGINPVAAAGTKPITWFKSYRYNGMFEYRRQSGNNMSVINILPLQDYIKGVIPYEMSPSWPIEALKAQALCAKSEAVTKTRHKSAGFDVCNTTDCQVYYGTVNATDNSNRAVDETYGQYVYYNGQIASCYYHSSDGGSTESALNVWGSEIAYLQAVTDIYEITEKSQYGIWQSEYSPADVKKVLADKGVTTGTIVDLYVDQFTPAGNVYRIVAVDSAGKKYTYERERARTILNSSYTGLQVRSQRYTITPGGTAASGLSMIAASSGGSTQTSTVTSTNGLYVLSGSGTTDAITWPLSDIQVQTGSGAASLTTGGVGKTGNFVISGRGWGNNVGMSQYGARDMANLGFDHEDIIAFYYQGVYVD